MHVQSTTPTYFLATDYTVGDSSGWSMGADYSTWTSGKTFAVGDTLVFNYPSGHTVDEVSEKDYSACSTGNSITTDSSGATTVTLKTAGKHYFMCGVPGHCSGGMKLAVTVAAAAGAGGGATTTPSGSTTSPPSSTTGSPATPTTVTTPTAGTITQSSSAATLSTVSAVYIISSCLILESFLW
ncbi:Cupredoxin superfamily protein [Abeliophyllum distichum]|uniref:Cupredoxin superfamily protein n=1 Tax=Abeliophyllum distichum TaxID=126358 RepID=A0ABD1SAT6_9LAMI